MKTTQTWPDSKVQVGPGRIPDIDLDSPVDPGRMDRMNVQAVNEANKAGKQLDTALKAADQQLAPKGLDKEVKIDLADAPELPDTTQLPEFAELNAMNLDAELQKALDDKLATSIQAQLNAEGAKAVTAHEALEKEQKAQLDTAVNEAARLNLEAQQEQQAQIDTVAKDIKDKKAEIKEEKRQLPTLKPRSKTQRRQATSTRY